MQFLDAKWILHLAKFHHGARALENVYIVHQPRRRPNIMQSLVGFRHRCSNEAKMWNPLKFAGVQQSKESISAASRPKFAILRGHVGDILLFNKFFPIVDMCLSCEDIARQNCVMVPKWRFLFFCVLYFQRAACRTFQTCILNSH